MRHGIGITLFTLAVAGTALARSSEKDNAPKTESAHEEVVALKKGGAHTLRIKGVTRVALGDPEIAKVELTGDDTLRVTALTSGETTLILWSGPKQDMTVYRIVVKG
ncbi:pilus assembly protein N-terminal domain-containing protein [Pyxidicoccus xibeiensis]|uniref:pilus assembly protein N-terminal domain-containing protein n=1 Tax=Pyxidicoccus xibeiensis TaxID=2906759 RepID=UPI0020A755EC|nr:pilus assembly protein N-terminal domain-containing protein [Pyxidicoccus xibeiensis]MCP3137018.1 pilus assembly protein N-terminal domain-containing protein [Pyxidicoccus xibeiensis]